MRSLSSKIVSFGLGFFLTPSLALSLEKDPIQAHFFLGKWKCEVVDKNIKFQWDVELVLGGAWLAGKTTSKGVVQSMDLWKIDKNQQPTLRRVFLAEGSLVESSSVRGWRKKKLKSRGKVIELKREIETRGTIRWIDENTFEASLAKKKELKWEADPKEICTRSK